MKSFKCHLCDREFKNKRNLNNHCEKQVCLQVILKNFINYK